LQRGRTGVPVVGHLIPGSRAANADKVASFLRGLAKLVIEERSSGSRCWQPVQKDSSPQKYW
jgi:hypothetical protein